MRRCEKLAELYGAYVYGEVTPEEERDILDHLEACEKCRVDVEARKSVIGKIPNAFPRLSDDDRQAVAFAVMSGIRKQKEERSWWRTVSPFVQTVSVAASIVIVFAGGTMFGFHLKGKARSTVVPSVPEKSAPDIRPEATVEVQPPTVIDQVEPAPITTGDPFDRQFAGPGPSRRGWNPRQDWINGPWQVPEKQINDTPDAETAPSEGQVPDEEKAKEQDGEDYEAKDKALAPVDTTPYLWNAPEGDKQ